MATIWGNLKVLWKGETACFSSFSVYRVDFRDLSDKSMDFWMKTDSICFGKPCNTWAPTIHERFNPFHTFERISKIPERHVLARNPSPFCLQIGGTRNVRFGAPVKLGLEIFTCLGVYILRTLRVSVFADWWRPYNAFQGFRFEVSALASILAEKRQHLWSKSCIFPKFIKKSWQPFANCRNSVQNTWQISQKIKIFSESSPGSKILEIKK